MTEAETQPHLLRHLSCHIVQEVRVPWVGSTSKHCFHPDEDAVFVRKVEEALHRVAAAAPDTDPEGGTARHETAQHSKAQQRGLSVSYRGNMQPVLHDTGCHAGHSCYIDTPLLTCSCCSPGRTAGCRSTSVWTRWCARCGRGCSWHPAANMHTATQDS